MKAAETDATKRALATFGNPFGLALYDRDQAHVTKPRKKSAPATRRGMQHNALILSLDDGRTRPFADHVSFVDATLHAIQGLASVEAVYAFWSANLKVFTELKRRSEGQSDNPIDTLITALKGRLRSFSRQASSPDQFDAGGSGLVEAPSSTGALALPKERRLRDKAHLTFVAKQPCLVCGRRPCQAHHLRFAQPRAMSMKVSDEFTVPLCNTHHDDLHKSGDERAWWARNGIVDPLKFAARLWAASRGFEPDGDATMNCQRETDATTPDAPNAGSEQA
jgi:hypothetical protein